MSQSKKENRLRWTKARAAEKSYQSQLKKVGKMVGMLVKGMAPDGTVKDAPALIFALEQYANILTPWAGSVAEYMLADVARRDAKMWKQNSQEMGRAIRVELQQAPTGVIFRELMAEQVALIKSLPLQAAQRVHDLTQASLTSGRRASDIQRDVMNLGSVTESRAALIARTEVSRAAANFMQARAVFAGSEGYIWRSSTDGDVRPTHAALEGKFIKWTDPPKTDAGLAPYHAGCGPNCRCFSEPLLPDL